MSDRVGLKIRMLDNLIQRNICRAMSGSEGAEVTYMNFWVINYVQECDPRPIYQKDIEQTLGINRATASKMLTTMEKKGLISRLADSKDRRLRRIVLEREALEYFRQHRQVVEALEEQMVRGLSREEVQEFLRIYDIIKTNLDL